MWQDFEEDGLRRLMTCVRSVDTLVREARAAMPDGGIDEDVRLLPNM